MLSKTVGYSLTGLIGNAIDVEVDVNFGMPKFEIVGLPDASVKESKERVCSAIKNSGKRFPNHRITVNLAPADIRKEGSGLDLPIALGIIKSDGATRMGDTSSTVLIGELSLDGSVRGVNGILPMLISAKENGFKEAVVPASNAKEGSFIKGIKIYKARSLKDVCAHFEGTQLLPEVETADYKDLYSETEYASDLKYVKGQYAAKRALEVAVSGNHNMIMVGPPGAGKTMLAKCIPSIMPEMSFGEALETTKIHSVAGILAKEGIVLNRPFMTPHHTASNVALVGGGSDSKPGIISLAHNGVLFLDEMPEYTRAMLESLRQPLEDRVITVSRAKANVSYPANFMLVGSMNPCPCGYYGSANGACNCTALQIQKYKAKVSGPLLDRMDIRVIVDGVKYDDLTGDADAESSAEVRRRVNAARKIQLERFKDDGITTNGEMGEKHIKKYCVLSDECEGLLRGAFEMLKLSARARSRIIKVARTIADMSGSENIEEPHILEAISYRSDEV